MSTVRANNYYDASGGSNAVFSGVASPPNSMGFRNRILNGDCRIDQRNAGASVTASNGNYTLDRWAAYANQASKFTVQRNAGSVTPPSGFQNYLGATSSSAYSVAAGDVFGIYQNIEGLNVADLGWGASGAQAITLSFVVRSSLTGTFGGSLMNSAQDRNYPFTYTISAANTWETKTITIAGDTSGTWVKDNGIGVKLIFGLGVGSTFSGTAGSWAAGNIWSATGATSVVGTNGATWYVTGVQLEAGTVASPFERRDYGRELMMCQRYYAKMSAAASNTYAAFGSGGLTSSTNTDIYIKYPVAMRASPTFAYGGTLGLSRAGNYYNVTGASGTYAGTDSMMQQIQATSLAGTAGQACVLLANADATCFIALSAEL